MKITNYGIQTTIINDCIAMHTIYVTFSYSHELYHLLNDSMFCNCYCIVIDKNGKEKLLVNYGTGDQNKFIEACKEFETISFFNKLNRLLSETSLSKSETSRILISKVAFAV
jgi:hypothetical protein